MFSVTLKIQHKLAARVAPRSLEKVWPLLDGGRADTGEAWKAEGMGLQGWVYQWGQKTRQKTHYLSRSSRMCWREGQASITKEVSDGPSLGPGLTTEESTIKLGSLMAMGMSLPSSGLNSGYMYVCVCVCVCIHFLIPGICEYYFIWKKGSLPTWISQGSLDEEIVMGYQDGP